jgi:hypothetical protein
VAVAHAYTPSYSGGRDQEDRGLKPGQANCSRDPILKSPVTKNWAGGVAQDEGSEFKPQYWKKNKSSWEREIIMDYTSWTHIIIRVLIPIQEDKFERCDNGDERCYLCCWLWRWRKKGPWVEKCRWPLETRRGKKKKRKEKKKRFSPNASTLI